MIPPFDLDQARSAHGFWYLATPYTRYPRGIAAAARDAALVTAGLMRLGIAVFSPIVHTHGVAIEGGLDALDVDFWLKVDRPFMQAASGLIVAKLDGWTESVGIAHEVEVFGREGKPIEYLSLGALRHALDAERRRLAAMASGRVA